jgi:hypothetical protein
MSYPMPTIKFSNLDSGRAWQHIEGAPLFVGMDKHM